MAKLFQTGNSSNDDLSIVTLELTTDSWFRRAFLRALLLMTQEENWQKDGDATIDYARDKANEMYVSVAFDMALNTTPIGAYLMMAGETIPSGYLLCVGTEVSRSTYAALFDEIGETYGSGDGTSTFNLPDFREKSPMGTEGSIAGIVGATYGELAHTLTEFEIPSHNHSITDPGHNHTITSPFTSFIGARPTGGGAAVAGTTLAGGAALNANTTGIAVNSTGGGLEHNNVHPVVGVRWWIYSGVDG